MSLNAIRDAVILVAGTGSRLRPLTESRHKSMIEVGGQPLLFRLLDQLGSAGIQRVTLATGYRGESVQSAATEYATDFQIEAAPNPDYDSTNNAESLRIALSRLGERPFLLCDGDILLREASWLESMLASPDESRLAVLEHDAIADEEMKAVMDGDAVEALSKEIDPDDADAESIGVQTVGRGCVPRLAQRLESMSEPERADAYYEDIFAELIADGEVFYSRAIPEGTWTEIDTAEDLDEARSMAESWAHSDAAIGS
jgi:choline kinase